MPSSVFMSSCVGSNLGISRSPVQGVLPAIWLGNTLMKIGTPATKDHTGLSCLIRSPDSSFITIQKRTTLYISSGCHVLHSKKVPSRNLDFQDHILSELIANSSSPYWY
jgi:hypothetical protein